MTPFASVALIRREGQIVFRKPRKERPDVATQARKAAARFWGRTPASTDKLMKLIILREIDGKIEIAERPTGETVWTEYTSTVQEAMREPHLAACLAELGIAADYGPPPMPDTLIINGHIYRKDI